uniref:Uncharacterized protein n=1 Tax=Ditylenchus dipsaci TaxID=166011 RepID=A0A915CX66_9BILA
MSLTKAIRRLILGRFLPASSWQSMFMIAFIFAVIVCVNVTEAALSMEDDYNGKIDSYMAPYVDAMHEDWQPESLRLKKWASQLRFGKRGNGWASQVRFG